MAAGALVVDTRSEAQRSRDGELPGAVVIERNVLEWRLDPASAHRLPEAGDPDRRIVVSATRGTRRPWPPRRGRTWACGTPPTSTAATRPGRRSDWLVRADRRR